MTRHHSFVVGVASVAALALAGCGDVSLTSTYRTDPIVVDGQYSDWHDHMKFIEKANLSVGAMNDATDLYVIIVVGDREVQRSIMMNGLFLWFDPTGKTERQFGIHYPLGMTDAERDAERGPGMRGARPGAPGAGSETPGVRPMEGDPTRMREQFERERLAEAQIIGAGGDERLTRAIGELPGMELVARLERGALVVEYRIPIAAGVDNPYGIGAVAGETIGVGLMTPETKKPEGGPGAGRRPPPGGMGGGDDGDDSPGGGRPPMGGGGMGGGRGGPGGPGGMRPPGGGFDAPEPISLWATLVLAAPPRAGL